LASFWQTSNMDNELWSNVDDYLVAILAPSDASLDAALADSTAGGLPQINVAPNQGKLLELLATIRGARRILEIGTLGGYSTIWLARALGAEEDWSPRTRAAPRGRGANQHRSGGAR